MDRVEVNPSLELTLSPFQSLSTSLQPTVAEPRHRFFTCNYCRRMFYSSQALGGHQNAHKLERSLVKRRRQMHGLALGPHSGSSSLGGAYHDHPHHGPPIWLGGQEGAGREVEEKYMRKEIDLSLRL